MNNSQVKYIEEFLVPEIVSKFENETILDFKIDYSGGLDGFMSALYSLTIRTTLNQQNNNIKERSIFVKLMKGDDTFRESSKSYTQFANEVCIYDKILPAYDALLKKAKITDVSVKDWVAHCYVAKFGFIEGLSIKPTSHESVLVLENLKSHDYKMGPRVYLNNDHLFLMARNLGQFHAMTYAQRLHNMTTFNTLRKEMIPISVLEPSASNQTKPNLYAVLHRISFDRFFQYFENLKKLKVFDVNNPDDMKLLVNLQRLHDKYFEKPATLLEHLRTSIEFNEEDRRFAVFVHGDYNRNNVMFRYKNEQKESKNVCETVEDVKMFDFQESRYGSPAVDLSFFMYFNTADIQRAENWMDIVKCYHAEMYKTLERTLLGLEIPDYTKVLEQYGFNEFYAHFSRFAMFGVMICVQYLPWLLCSEEECSQLSYHFETDMHSVEFYKIAMSAGGDDANSCTFNIVRHASKLGYMDYL